jgi:hypothetical protein
MRDGEPTAKPVHSESGSEGTAELLREIAGQLADLREFVGRLVDAQVDLARLRVRHAVMRVGFWIGLFFVSITTVVYSMAYLLEGTADGLAAILGADVWVGRLLAGAAGLCGTALVVTVALKRSIARHRRERIANYESRKTHQGTRHARHDKHHARNAA